MAGLVAEHALYCGSAPEAACCHAALVAGLTEYMRVWANMNFQHEKVTPRAA